MWERGGAECCAVGYAAVCVTTVLLCNQTTREFYFFFDFAMNNSTEISAFGPMADVENGDCRF